MKKHAPYEHEYVEGFDKLENLETYADMEAISQLAQTQQVGPTPQHNPQKLILQVPKVTVYTKRSSSEALGTSSQQTTPKKIKITQLPQIVDLEE